MSAPILDIRECPPPSEIQSNLNAKNSHHTKPAKFLRKLSLTLHPKLFLYQSQCFNFIPLITVPFPCSFYVYRKSIPLISSTLQWANDAMKGGHSLTRIPEQILAAVKSLEYNSPKEHHYPSKHQKYPIKDFAFQNKARGRWAHSIFGYWRCAISRGIGFRDFGTKKRMVSIFVILVYETNKYENVLASECSKGTSNHSSMWSYFVPVSCAGVLESTLMSL